MQSTQKYIRTSARKLRLVAAAVRHLTPKDALAHLKFTPKAASLPLAKTIKAAVGNAKENFGLPIEKLAFKTIDIGEGATFKRFRAVSRGMAHHIMKRTAQIKVELKEAHGTKS
ncbi:MAG: large subunit ribosomal protein L22 [uncultured bacterium]|jgi:large subunit ribosomal protein L22|uniref:50S ribosomal protein L22 n=2 Tax=Candidatus Collieribacteriota TaxID=1752725 RepID=A0A1F5FXE2_9BACT|nr:MAG: large subunit ribosomal protein L22 [uncultured bacterium]KKU21604.1 MAG: 50S ribosomal protein L22 [Microgenomates group bacterium GW2011_GWF1_46_12]KKU26892.1 MAG: 50S ribosomal protein L22 [Microgenomates group bacterium GW2011_GWC1_46_16]KKU28308.1 MAG: 50S ribosomal protein L22 [Microgenomates group bacterium GW2011_GWF2_46_18]KKU44153.1 MAG: 50S ribosomal protein L22 [Microgenomates group bacterium GW2011_GWA1_46_7]KKU45531.1 MAG: 50S ribosomal protein L22 [Microgenomates group b